MLRLAVAAAIFAIAPGHAAAAEPARTPIQAVEAYVTAQRAFDTGTMSDVLAPDFVEISPVGEVDPRAEVLGFYNPANRSDAPPVTMSETDVRERGDIAIVTARLAFGPGAMRAVYVARRQNGGWTLVSAQYTPIRGGAPAQPR